MTQLKDDCFDYGETLTPISDAIERLKKKLSVVVGTEQVPLPECLGRVLACDIISPRDVPPHDNSAVDGYAVFFDDLNSDDETRLPVTARIAAGSPAGTAPNQGEAAMIFTGAPMPGGMDTVFMVENCRLDGDHVIVPAGIKQGANRRFRAEDVAEGAVILAAGRRLQPHDLGLAASVGPAVLSVYARLKVAVFSTGDELRQPGEVTPPGCVYDANRFAIMGLLGDLGCAVTDLGILPDRFETIRDALAEAAQSHDVLITSGGVSLGEEDHVKAAVEANGQLHFWRLAIKPGRPVAFGQVGNAVFIGLPGNPVAAVVTFLMVARPVILLLSGRNDLEPRCFPVRAGFEYRKKTGRREWLRVRLRGKYKDGLPVAELYHAAGSGILTSMVWADGLADLPEDQGTISEGTEVNFLPFGEVRQ